MKCCKNCPNLGCGNHANCMEYIIESSLNDIRREEQFKKNCAKQAAVGVKMRGILQAVKRH